MENNILYCWVGGGIVLDLYFEEEFDEILVKVVKILLVLEFIFVES